VFAGGKQAVTRAERAKFGGGWRLWAVRLVLCAFVLQSVGLFAVSSSKSAGPVAAAATMGVPNCLHHGASRQDQQKPAQDEGCPVCQTIGCALAGAPIVALTALPGEKLIGLLAAAQPEAPPAAPPRQDARPRGPPHIS
jgi:hypothetical protein